MKFPCFSYTSPVQTSNALQMASQNGHVKVVNILLQNGASVDLQDDVSLAFS